MQTLTRNQQIVFDIINKSSEPLKAYTILSNVQKKGIKAPPQVYRTRASGHEHTRRTSNKTETEERGRGRGRQWRKREDEDEDEDDKDEQGKRCC